MQVYHEYNFKNSKPRILGLTATLINSNPKNVKEELQKLQINFDAKIKTRHDQEIIT